MPYRDPEQRAQYQRDYKRMQRAGECQTPSQTLVPLPFRLKTAADVLALLAEQVNAVRGDPGVDPTERARTLAFLAGLALRAMDARDGEARLEAVERVLKLRKDQERRQQELDGRKRRTGYGY